MTPHRDTAIPQSFESLLHVESPSKHMLGYGWHVGYHWRIFSNALGFRCGYVEIPREHPWHGRHYTRIDADVHGDLTFASFTHPDPITIRPGSWWVGFDCGHVGDAPDPVLPCYSKIPSLPGAVIRDQAYVEAECRKLCKCARLAEHTRTP